MAVASPSTGGLASAFSPYSASDSPSSPSRFGSPYANHTANANNRYAIPDMRRQAMRPHVHVLIPGRRSSIPPDSLAPPASPYPQQIEPSPVDSNGTASTEIEDDEQEDERRGTMEGDESLSPDIEITSPESVKSVSEAQRVSSQDESDSHQDIPPRLDTQLLLRTRSDSTEDAPQSVIHVPEGFKSFDKAGRGQAREKRFDNAAGVSPITPEAAVPSQDLKVSLLVGCGKSWMDSADIGQNPLSPPQVNTDIPRVMDRATPRAQTRQESEEEHNKRKSRRTSSLEGEQCYKNGGQHGVLIRL
jgi:hypothetical protein